MKKQSGLFWGVILLIFVAIIACVSYWAGFQNGHDQNSEAEIFTLSESLSEESYPLDSYPTVSVRKTSSNQIELSIYFIWTGFDVGEDGIRKWLLENEHNGHIILQVDGLVGASEIGDTLLVLKRLGVKTVHLGGAALRIDSNYKNSIFSTRN